MLLVFPYVLLAHSLINDFMKAFKHSVHLLLTDYITPPLLETHFLLSVIRHLTH